MSWDPDEDFTEDPIVVDGATQWYVPFAVGDDYYLISDIDGTKNADTLIMTDNRAGGDILWIPTAGDYRPDRGWAIFGDAGSDLIKGYTLSDWIRGGTGDDELWGMGDHDSLQGGSGNDLMYGGDGDDTLDGGNHNDKVYGDAGDDRMAGEDGNDWMNGGQGADTMAGGLGNDSYLMSKNDSDTDQIVENIGEGTDWVYTDRASYTLNANVEGLILTASMTTATTLNGNDLKNDIRGAEGADSIWGLIGNDTLRGNGGNDQLVGGFGNDTLFGGNGADRLYGNENADYMDGGAGADTMDGGVGNDTFVVEDTTDVVVELAGAGTDTVHSLLLTTTLGANLENLQMLYSGASNGYGNALNNVINGSVYNNVIDAMAGNDTVNANFGNDSVLGNLGNDSLMGEVGNDSLYGGDGDDTLDGGIGLDMMYGGNGNDLIRGGDGTDYAYGGAGNDIIYGDLGSNNVSTDYLLGDAGDDTIYGEAGNDLVRGGDGNDKVYGGAGNDSVMGEAGVDLLYGEAGSDIFMFRNLSDAPMSGLDRVMDFVQGTDKIDLSWIDANSATTATNEAFHFNAVKPFFASAGDLNISTNLLGTLVEGDVNGDGISDFKLLVVGNYSMLATDFIL